MVLSFTIAAGPRQRGHSQVRVPQDSWTPFTVSDSRFPQSWGSGPRIYIPQEQDGAVISPGTGFPFRRLLRLARLRWRYSNPPPHGCLFSSTTLPCTTYVASRRIRNKHVHFLAMDVYCCPERASTGPLPSNGCPLVERLCHGNVFVDSFPSNGSTCL
jgi:hypothetical protein